MNDRELLELAAKAAGIELTKEKTGDDEFFTRKVGHGSYSNVWNPLTDDGDALRLAVRLTLEVDITRSGVAVRTSSGHKVLINDKPDPYAATRRAIVMAAAEIAKLDGK